MSDTCSGCFQKTVNFIFKEAAMKFLSIVLMQLFVQES